MSAIDTSAAAMDGHRDELEEPVTVSEHELEDGDFISFSESAPLRPFSLLSEADERSSFLSLTPDPALEVPLSSSMALAGDSSFLSFTDTPPASSTPDPLSETLSVVHEEEEEEEDDGEGEEDIGGDTKLEEEEAKDLEVGDRDEEIDLGDAILLESGRSENVVVDMEAGDFQAAEQTGFYYDKELKRWVPGKKA